MFRTLTLILALAAAATTAAPTSAQVSPPPAASSAGAGQPSQAQPAAAVPVVMYATEWCPYCAEARTYFKRTNTAYVEHDIEKSADARTEFKRLGGRGVPLILVGSQKMAGFSELAFESAYARAERAQ